MKVYRISKWTFYGICLLILILPVSRKWKLIVDGTRTKGVVSRYHLVPRETVNGKMTLNYASEILYTVEDSTYTTHGPVNFEYEYGREVRVIYETGNPSNSCILTFYGFYLSNYSALPLVLLVLWAAFYLSFNNYSKAASTGS